VLSNISVKGESAEQADVLTYRDGRVIQFRSLSEPPCKNVSSAT
jgi:hypothetical protein